MSNRQQIIDAIETRLKTILTTGGYATNAGQHVYVWRTTPLADADLPALLVSDTGVTKNMDVSTLDTDYWDLLVDIEAATTGSSSREVMRSILADVRKAVKVDLTWGGLALHTAFESADIALEQGEKLTGGNMTRLRIIFQE